jgi:zinc and cadmium transporter
MPTEVLLLYYCLLILVASILGGMIPNWVRLTHRRMEFAVSFVAGVMLGVALFHLIPHAFSEIAGLAPDERPEKLAGSLMCWVLLGFLVMFFIERFFCYHHHEILENDPLQDDGEHHHGHDHTHELTWSGAALGLTLHSVLAGFALAASVQHVCEGSVFVGFGTFLVIFLHKPFDSMTICMLMAHGGWSPVWRHIVNGLFALAIPVGAAIFYTGWMVNGVASEAAIPERMLAQALSFSAGMFLCISMSDLLPELQFHQHDRIKLSVALLLGLLVAYLAGHMEGLPENGHDHGKPQASQQGTPEKHIP